VPDTKFSLFRDRSTRSWLLLLAGLVFLSLLALGWLAAFGNALPRLTRLPVGLHSDLRADYSADARTMLPPLNARIIEDALRDQALFETPVAIQRILFSPVPSVTPLPGAIFPTPTEPVPTATLSPQTPTQPPAPLATHTSPPQASPTPTARRTGTPSTPTATRLATSTPAVTPTSGLGISTSTPVRGGNGDDGQPTQPPATANPPPSPSACPESSRSRTRRAA